MKAIGYTANGADRPARCADRARPARARRRRAAICWSGSRPFRSIRSTPRSAATTRRSDGFRVLGFDAVGTVEAIGADAALFKPGDRVWYAGSILRPGSNAELQLVDERIVGPAPKSLSRRRCRRAAAHRAHRVGDAVRPLRRRPAGADGQPHDPDHRRRRRRRLDRDPARQARRRHDCDRHRLAPRDRRVGPADGRRSRRRPQQAARRRGRRRCGIGAPGFVFSTTETEQHFDQIVELIAPQGRLGVISGIGASDANKLSGKSIALCFELMFTRSIFGTARHRRAAPHPRRGRAARRRRARSRPRGPSISASITAANLIRAHAQLETGTHHRQGRARRVLELPASPSAARR